MDHLVHDSIVSGRVVARTLVALGFTFLFACTSSGNKPQDDTGENTPTTESETGGQVNPTSPVDNTAPVLGEISVIDIEEDGIFVVALSATDAEEDSLVYSISESENIDAFISGDELTLVPSPNYNGSELLTISVSDGNLTTSTTVEVNVASVNDAPELETLADIGFDEDTSFVVSLSATDVEDDSLVYSISESENINASISGNDLTLTPSPNYNGSETFTVSVSDGSLTDSATVEVNVASVNDAPVIGVINAVTFDEDTSERLTLSGSDADGDALVYSVSSSGHISASISGGELTLNPRLNFNGEDTIVVTVTDGTESDTETISITISPINDPPVLRAISGFSLEAPFVRKIQLVGNDPEGDTLQFSVSSSENITATLVGTEVTFEAAASYKGTEFLTATVSDGELSQSETFMVEVVDHSEYFLFIRNEGRPAVGEKSLSAWRSSEDTHFSLSHEGEQGAFSIALVEGDLLRVSFNEGNSVDDGDGLRVTVRETNPDGTFTGQGTSLWAFASRLMAFDKMDLRYSSNNGFYFNRDLEDLIAEEDKTVFSENFSEDSGQDSEKKRAMLLTNVGEEHDQLTAKAYTYYLNEDVDGGTIPVARDVDSMAYDVSDFNLDEVTLEVRLSYQRSAKVLNLTIPKTLKTSLEASRTSLVVVPDDFVARKNEVEDFDGDGIKNEEDLYPYHVQSRDGENAEYLWMVEELRIRTSSYQVGEITLVPSQTIATDSRGEPIETWATILFSELAFLEDNLLKVSLETWGEEAVFDLRAFVYGKTPQQRDYDLTDTYVSLSPECRSDGDCWSGQQCEEFRCQLRGGTCEAPLSFQAGEVFSGDTSDGRNHVVQPENSPEVSSCAGGGIANDAVFVLEAEQDGIVCLTTNGSDYDTALFVLAGDCDGELLACDDDGGEGNRSEIELEVLAGENYTVVVDGYDDRNGKFAFKSRQGECDDEIPFPQCDDEGDCSHPNAVCDAGECVLACADVTECHGENRACFEQVCVGCYDHGDCQGGALGDYCVNNECVACTEDPEEVCGNGTTCSPLGMCVSEPTGDAEGLCGSPKVLSDFGYYTGSVIGANLGFESTCGSGAEGPEVVYSFSVTTAGPVCASTDHSAFDTVLHIRTSCDSGNSYEVACDDDAASGNTSEVEFDAEPGVEYLIFVDSYNETPDEGDYMLELKEGSCLGI